MTKERAQKDKQPSTKHTHKAKDRVTIVFQADYSASYWIRFATNRGSWSEDLHFAIFTLHFSVSEFKLAIQL